MTDFDVDVYYAEQDEWMNTPNETVDEFLKRVSSLPRGPGSFSYASASRLPAARNSVDMNISPSGIAAASAAKTGEAPTSVDVEDIQIPLRDPTADFGRTLKRKAVDQELEIEHVRKKSNDRNHSQKIEENNPPVFPTNANVSDMVPSLSAPPASAEVEEIDSFSVDLTGSQIPSKLKTPPRPARQSPRNKKLPCGNLAPQIAPNLVTADHSPILSFSKSKADAPKKRGSFRKDAVASVPPLDLRPLRKATDILPAPKKTKRDDVDYDSPIEDASISTATPTSPKKKKRLEAKPSEMYLEMKERMEKHSKRDKVVKSKSKPVLPKPNGSAADAAHHNDEPPIIHISSSPSSRASSLGPTESSASKKKQGVKEKPVKPSVVRRVAKGKKEKPQPMTPVEYARFLQPNPADEVSGNASSSTTAPSIPRRKKSTSKVLAGKNIVYLGGDMRHASEGTRGRMDIIVRNGGNLMPEYDPAITTHIIAEASLGTALRALGLQSYKQIPNHIPTLKWDWILAAIDLQARPQDEIDIQLSDYSRYAAYAERIDAGCELRLPVTSAASLRLKAKGRAMCERSGEGSKSGNATPAVQPEAPVASDTGAMAGPSNTVIPVGAPLSPPTSPLRPIGPQRAVRDTSALRKPGQDDSGEAHDPLADFYHQAKLQRDEDDGWSSFAEFEAEGRESEDEKTDDEAVPQAIGKVPKQKRGWTCDKKAPQNKGDCPNQDIIDKLTELMELHRAKQTPDDHWRAYTYSKAVRALKDYPQRIKNFHEARGIKGIGEKTAQKIEEILQTGDLRRIKYETTKDVQVTRIFQGIYGVGQHIAYQWYLAGCRTLDDLKSGVGGVKLTPAQEIGLQFYDDINDRMPRAEAKAIFDLIKPIALSIDPKLFIEIMGSFRRGKADCGDIDVLITRPTDDGKTHMGVMSRLLHKLHSAHILTEDLALPEDPYDLECTYRGLCRLPDVKQSRRRRIDILCVPWKSRGAALLYYTGDDIFNRAIRLKASYMGYSLNQKGLSKGVVRDPHDRRVKLNPGVIIASETEEEIFKILGVPWQEPHERVRG
ncbi:hypothetical protein BDN70DRAFT_915818 [Pholiota conissans]|uniref:DNA-directed DNA polymerase n=1 Tax=Pholiota conissans TaxID=109636 RepID=A0A9P5YPG1_9AGAR|nr:hypothetical protein BDN70DRAFT_915818 [Pholiota conissans]